MTNDSSVGASHAKLELNSPLVGEASALVARLLAEPDEERPVRIEAPLSPQSPAPPASHSTLPPVGVSPAPGRNERVLSLPNRRALLPYSGASAGLAIFGVVALIFGAGILVGYSISDPVPKPVISSAAQSEPPAANTASKPIDAQAGMLSAAAVPPLNRPKTAHEPNSARLAHEHSDPLPESGSNNDHQEGTTAQTARIDQAEYNAPSMPDSGDASVSSTPPHPQSADLRTRTSAAPQAGTSISTQSAPNASEKSADAPAGLVHGESAQTISPDSDNELAASQSTNTSALTASSAADPQAANGQATAPGASAESREPVGASTGAIAPSQLIRSVPPVYPPAARSQHIEGDVHLRLVIGKDGAVQSVGLISGPPSLAPAAIDAARQFLYKPALLNGEPIETVQTVAISFKLPN
jgi:TonB family protein